MKTTKSISTILLIFLVLSLFQISCGTMEKSALSCPEVSMKKNNKFLSYHKGYKKKTIDSQKEKNKFLALNHSKARKEKEGKDKTFVPATLSPIERVPYINKVEYSKGLIASTNNHYYPTVDKQFVPPVFKMSDFDESVVPINVSSTGCDTIILKSGSFLIGKVEEIGQSEIKYRRCNNLTGPIISISKNEVSSIHYSNGTRDFFDPSDAFIPNRTIPTNNNINVALKTEGLGIAGFISGLVGLFIAGIPLGAIGVVFGGISLSKIKKQPQRFKGKGFAIASIIIGLIAVVGAIIVLATV
jgi:hypothetical protein